MAPRTSTSNRQGVLACQRVHATIQGRSFPSNHAPAICIPKKYGKTAGRMRRAFSGPSNSDGLHFPSSHVRGQESAWTSTLHRSGSNKPQILSKPVSPSTHARGESAAPKGTSLRHTNDSGLLLVKICTQSYTVSSEESQLSSPRAKEVGSFPWQLHLLRWLTLEMSQ